MSWSVRGSPPISCSPARIGNFLLHGIGVNAKQLAFTPLRRFAGFLESEFAALFGARVALQEAESFYFYPQILVVCDQRPGQAVAHRLRLGVSTAAGDSRLHVPLPSDLALPERVLDKQAFRLCFEIILGLLAVYHKVSLGGGGDAHTGGGSFASAYCFDVPFLGCNFLFHCSKN